MTAILPYNIIGKFIPSATRVQSILPPQADPIVYASCLVEMSVALFVFLLVCYDSRHRSSERAVPYPLGHPSGAAGSASWGIPWPK